MKIVLKYGLYLIILNLYSIVVGYFLALLFTNLFVKFIDTPSHEYGKGAILLTPILCLLIPSVVYLSLIVIRSISFRKRFLACLTAAPLIALSLCGWEFISSKFVEKEKILLLNENKRRLEILDRPVFTKGSCILPYDKKYLQFKVIEVSDTSYYVKVEGKDTVLTFRFRDLNNSHYIAPCDEK